MRSKPTPGVAQLDAFEHLLLGSTLRRLQSAREHGGAAEQLEQLRHELAWVQGAPRPEAIAALRLLATDEAAALKLVNELLERGPLPE
jgi:hypothetical protein